MKRKNTRYEILTETTIILDRIHTQKVFTIGKMWSLGHDNNNG